MKITIEMDIKNELTQEEIAKKIKETLKTIDLSAAFETALIKHIDSYVKNLFDYDQDMLYEFVAESFEEFFRDQIGLAFKKFRMEDKNAVI